MVAPGKTQRRPALQLQLLLSSTVIVLFPHDSPLMFSVHIFRSTSVCSKETCPHFPGKLSSGTLATAFLPLTPFMVKRKAPNQKSTFYVHNGMFEKKRIELAAILPYLSTRLSRRLTIKVSPFNHVMAMFLCSTTLVTVSKRLTASVYTFIVLKK